MSFCHKKGPKRLHFIKKPTHSVLLSTVCFRISVLYFTSIANLNFSDLENNGYPVDY